MMMSHSLADLLIKEMMESEGIYRVKTARNSKEGYRVSLHFKPDIILTDIRMPGKNGFEMVRAIRIHNPSIRVILYTPYSGKLCFAFITG